MKWSIRETLPIGPPSAIRRAYSPFFIEWTETASVIVSTNPDCSPVINIRKNRTQQSVFSSLKIRLKSSISCVANCSCRRSVPVLTMTEMTWDQLLFFLHKR